MFPILIAAVLSTGPNIAAPDSGFAGDLVATWAHEDGPRSISINLDADGHCSVATRDASTGIAHETLCGYWILGSKVFLRARADGRPRPVLQAEYERASDELIVDGKPPLVFIREPIDLRVE